MFDSNENDPISPALRALLEVFAKDLAGVRFPDVDTAVLEEAAASTREKAELVAKAQAALEAARQALHESQEALLQKGQRALSYARVFAEDDADLSAKLDGVHLPRATRKAARTEPATTEPAATATPAEENAPRRRGRPPKARPAPGASLFADGATPEALAESAHATGNGMLHEA